MHSLLNVTLASKITALLDAADLLGTASKDRAIPREKAEEAIHAILWAYGCSQGSFAGAYATSALMEALNIEKFKDTSTGS